jgi:hypothetical protein
MARYTGSVTPGRIRKLPAGASNSQMPFIDDFDELSSDEYEFEKGNLIFSMLRI